MQFEDVAERISETFMDRLEIPPSPSGIPYPQRRALTIDDVAGRVARACDVEKHEFYCYRSSSAAV